MAAPLPGTPAGNRHRPLLGLAFRLASATLIPLVMVLVKLSQREAIALLPLIFFRQAVPLAMLSARLAVRGQFGLVYTRRPLAHATRCIAGIAGLFLIAAGVQLLPLAEATIYGFTAPIFAVVLAAAVLREQVGAIRWLAVVVGLIGVIVMVGGGGGHQNLLGVACAIGGAVCVAATAIQLRDLGRTESSLTIIFWYFLITSLVLAAPVLATWQNYAPKQWAILLGAGVLTLFVQMFQTASVRFGNVSSVIVMDYTSLAWSTLWGWLIFSQLLPSTMWLGAPLIIAAGGLIIYRESGLFRRPEARGFSPE